MQDISTYKQILPRDERYCIPSLNEVKIISDKQTLSLALGSCISTIMIGKEKDYYLAANHIVIAQPLATAIIATKSAVEQIEEIVNIFSDVLHIKKFYCLHLLGAGVKLVSSTFDVHEKNVIQTLDALFNKNINIIFNDTGSYFFSSYSLYGQYLSVFLENKKTSNHKSFVINLEQLFTIDVSDPVLFPTSMLDAKNNGFEYLVEKMIITSITGKRSINPI